MLATTRPPSSGGIGIRLKAISITFICTPAIAILLSAALSNSAPGAESFIRSAQPIAIMTLATGPAIATHSMSRFGLRKLPKFTGTGFAHPNRIGEWISNSIPGRSTVPIGSMCFSGFAVTRPSIQAVWSPKIRATYPCAASCKVIAKTTGTA